jgi:hypothetical protein
VKPAYLGDGGRSGTVESAVSGGVVGADAGAGEAMVLILGEDRQLSYIDAHVYPEYGLAVVV